jgi:catechol 2,3-dioxygenase-like lactoylglutathione lyase family enzyme
MTMPGWLAYVGWNVPLPKHRLLMSARYTRPGGSSAVYRRRLPVCGNHQGLFNLKWFIKSGDQLTMDQDLVHVRYMVDDVDAAVAFYTTHLGFTLLSSAAPAFADIVRGKLRLLLSGRTSSAGRAMPDGRQPGPGGWNRIHLLVDDITADVARLRAAGVTFRNDVVTGPGGKQILFDDPSGNPIELFQPAQH